jgi:hypothetical protein
MSRHKDYYAILGVKPDADHKTIEAAYNRLARRYQPDADRPPHEPHKLAELDEAFDVLDVPERRAEYDSARGIGHAAKPAAKSTLSRRPAFHAAAALALVIAVATAAALTLLLAAGGSGNPSSAPQITLRILSPRNGETVSNPVTIRVTSTGVPIAAPSEGMADAAHYHAFLDIHPFTPVNRVIPDMPGVVHFSTDTIELELEPGEHSLVVALGGNDHVRLEGAPVHAINFTVE